MQGSGGTGADTLRGGRGALRRAREGGRVEGGVGREVEMGAGLDTRGAEGGRGTDGGVLVIVIGGDGVTSSTSSPLSTW